MSNFSNITHPVARKQHICDYCGRVIKPGELYNTFCGNAGDVFRSEKICSGCFRIVEDFIEATNKLRFQHEDVREWLRTTFCAECNQYSDNRCGSGEEAPEKCAKIRKAYEISSGGNADD